MADRISLKDYAQAEYPQVAPPFQDLMPGEAEPGRGTIVSELMTQTHRIDGLEKALARLWETLDPIIGPNREGKAEGPTEGEDREYSNVVAHLRRENDRMLRLADRIHSHISRLEIK